MTRPHPNTPKRLILTCSAGRWFIRLPNLPESTRGYMPLAEPAEIDEWQITTALAFLPEEIEK